MRDYTHHIEAEPGFSIEVDTEICRAAKIEQCIERERFVILLLDEIHVKEDLVYNKHTGELIGFSFLNEIWSDLDSLEEKVTESSFPTELLANSMMTFISRVCCFCHRNIQNNYAHKPAEKESSGKSIT